jgi:hypothetical protein
MTRRPRGVVSWSVVAAVLLVAVEPVPAQTASVPVLTAGFLFSFAKFTAWPADALPPARELSMCVVGDEAVRTALEQTVSGHTIDGRSLSVRTLGSSASASACHLLYVSGESLARATGQLEGVRGAAVFTVSDGERFAESGGIAELARVKGRMRFTVNLGAARRARLRLGSQLLNLATIIGEEQ